jgi:DNA-binding XRE family transcriptional regulator
MPTRSPVIPGRSQGPFPNPRKTALSGTGTSSHFTPKKGNYAMKTDPSRSQPEQTHEGDDPAFARELGQRLRAAREASKFTRSQVTEFTGIPAKSVEKFEAGQQQPSAERLIRLAKLFDTTVDASAWVPLPMMKL